MLAAGVAFVVDTPGSGTVRGWSTAAVTFGEVQIASGFTIDFPLVDKGF